MPNKLDELLNKPLTPGSLRLLIAVVTSTAIIVWQGAMSYNNLTNAISALRTEQKLRDTSDGFWKQNINNQIQRHDIEINDIKQYIDHTKTKTKFINNN